MKKIFIIMATLLLIVGCNKNENYYSKNLYYMDTIINIKIYKTNESKANEAFAKIDSLYNNYQKMTDNYNSESEISYINNNSLDDNEITISDELYNLIKIGQEWYNKSNGLLNINIGGLTKIWHDFRETETTLPTDDELNKVDININNINLLNNNKMKNTHPNIDLGAIAKGYVTEKAGEYLENMGLNYYIINAGGNVKVGKSNKGYYNIGIASPINDNETFMKIKGENISVVTSGSYERFYEYNGVLYHHIIDPFTKYPANYMKSVTVIGSDSGECDALSTILFLMSVDDGKAFIKKYDVDVIWYTNDNQIIKSDGFRYE